MLRHLEEYLQKLTPEGIALAYSGGVDSTLLLFMLGKLYQKQPFSLAVLTMQTVLQDDNEIKNAQKMVGQLGVSQKIFTFNPFSLNEVRHNRITRCYHCKKAIFTQFFEYARAKGIKYLLDGTNADDLTVYRPGQKALRELGVISPLSELGITKTKIREMSAELGLSTATKPAVPCLATRFEYDVVLNEDMIHRVAKGEEIIKKMFSEIKEVRLRVHGSLARLEIPSEKITQVASEYKNIATALKPLGFDYVTLDMEGFRSGSFDINLKGKK